MKYALLLMLCLPLFGYAAEYKQVVKSKSSIQFTYQQMGVKMTGHFADFTAQVNYDPAQMATASASFAVPLSAIRTGVAEADSELPNKLWFDRTRFPSATLKLLRLERNEKNQLSAAASLSIKGITQNITIPLKQTTQGNEVQLSGQFPIKRLDFAVGDGMWRDVSVVADQVIVTFSMWLSQ